MKYSSSSSVIINHPLAAVWNALTIPEQVKEYFFGTNQITDWVVGSPIVFRGEWEGKTYEDKGTVLSFNPPYSLSYSYWSSMSGTPDVPESYQSITYSLEEVPEGTKLTITQDGSETKEKADHSAENWKILIDGMKKMLDGKYADKQD
jgi:uncharacterized protein YndB with AHSA1/START domain